MEVKTAGVSFKVWEDLVIGRVNPDFRSLPVKVHLSYCRRRVKLDRSLRSVRKNALAFNDFFNRTSELPHVKRDFDKIVAR